MWFIELPVLGWLLEIAILGIVAVFLLYAAHEFRRGYNSR